MTDTHYTIAKYTATCEVIDPDTNGIVRVRMYKDPVSGGMFGVDESYVEYLVENNERVFLREPHNGTLIQLED
jgi:hypothetical protein